TVNSGRTPVTISRITVSDTLGQSVSFDTEDADIVITTSAPLAPPQNLETVLRADTVRLTWEPPGADPGQRGAGSSANLTGYHVYRSRTPLDLSIDQCIDTVGAAILTCGDTPVPDLYYYQVTAVYEEGESGPSNESWIVYNTAEKTGGEETPDRFELLQNYPNPFNMSTTVRYHLPESEFVRIDIYNILGHPVKTLVRENQDAGAYRVNWHGTNDRGNGVSSGLYFCVMRAGHFYRVIKLMVLK
ncbi:T9SS type A sorting domain-containing protein, partial [bacterium]|nr:T9SS type A sorting domain-containing protein [bacterium]